eukprot:RCo004699
MLAAPVIIAFCAIAETAWGLYCWACARQSLKAEHPAAQSEAAFGRPSNATTAAFGLSVGNNPRISLGALESGIDPGRGSSETHGSPTRTTPSRLLSGSCSTVGFPSNLIPLILLVHLLVCGAVSVSYLFPCEGAGVMLGAAWVGFGLCGGDGAALGVTFVQW